MQTASFKVNNSVTEPTSQFSSGVTAARAVTMRAIVHRSYGTSEVLERETIDLPTVGEKEVLIEVYCAALDRGTWHLMTGTPYLIRILGFGFLKPKQPIPGLDVAGRVVEVGSGVTRFAPGDEVFGIANGSFAEYTVANQDKLVAKPTGLTFEAAAATTVSGITALEALTDVGKLQAGQKDLVIGASGGVGSYVVQLAKALGAEVTGVASASNIDLLHSLGADHVIDYQTNYLADSQRKYDLIIDIAGRNKVSSLRAILTRQGTLVFVGGEGGNRITGGIGRQIGASLLSLIIEQRLTMFISSESNSIMQRLSEFIQSGAVTPSIGQRFELDDVPAAMQQLEAGNTRGKTVITVR
jgi:NADPH:quinone reductase-like Zn-dependent oxidoreductase